MPGDDKRRAFSKKTTKRPHPTEPLSSEPSSQAMGGQPDDISDLINAVKSKFSKKTSENQKHLEHEIEQKTASLCKEINEAFKSNESEMYAFSYVIYSESKVQAICMALEERREQGMNVIKRLKADYARFCAQATGAIETLDESNEHISRLIHDFEKEVETQRVKRKETFVSLAQETDVELESIKKKLLSYASKNSQGFDSVRSSLKALLNF